MCPLTLRRWNWCRGNIHRHFDRLALANKKEGELTVAPQRPPTPPLLTQGGPVRKGSGWGLTLTSHLLTAVSDVGPTLHADRSVNAPCMCASLLKNKLSTQFAL